MTGEVVENFLSDFRVRFDARELRTKALDIQPRKCLRFSEFDVHGQEVKCVNPQGREQIIEGHCRHFLGRQIVGIASSEIRTTRRYKWLKTTYVEGALVV